MNNAVISDRSPFKICLLILVTVAGIPLMLGISQNRITDQMGQPYANIWGGALSLGGLLNLIGTYWQWRVLRGMFIERSGNILLGGAAFIWSILVIWKTGTDGILSAFFTVALAIACAAEVRRINKQVKKVLEIINE